MTTRTALLDAVEKFLSETEEHKEDWCPFAQKLWEELAAAAADERDGEHV